MLPRLALNLTSLVVSLGDGGSEISVSWNHDQGNISLRSPGNHILDKVSVSWGINDGVVPFLSVEFLSGASNGDTTFTFFLLPVHEECKRERTLAKAFSFSLQFFQLAFWESTKLEDQPSSGGGFSRVNMTANDDGQVLLFRIGWHGAYLRDQQPNRGYKLEP